LDNLLVASVCSDDLGEEFRRGGAASVANTLTPTLGEVNRSDADRPAREV
jgi:hypothetical protein